MYTDTDSLIYRIECDDVYEQMKRDITRFDTSDYSIDNNIYGTTCKQKVPGLMKIMAQYQLNSSAKGSERKCMR